MTVSILIRFIALLCLLPAVAHGFDELEPGEAVSLGADEGLLVVAVDSRQPLYGLRLGRDGRLLGSAFLRKIPEGRSHRLFKVRTGDYQWMEAQPFAGWRFRLRDDQEFRFNVVAGVINYPGDLLFEASGFWRANLRLANRATAAIDWLRLTHPDLLRARGFSFVGRSPDPFPEAYLAAISDARIPGTLESEAARLREPPAPTALSIEPERLWRRETLGDLAMSPDGRFVAIERSVSEPLQGGSDAVVGTTGRPEKDPPLSWRVELIDLQQGSVDLISTSPLRFAHIGWSGSDRLVLEVNLFGQGVVELVRIQRDRDAKARFEVVRVPRRGSVIDPLPADPDHILLASRTRRGELMVHRVDVSSPDRIRAFNGAFSNRLNKGVKDDLTWLVDGHGRLRLALVSKDDKRVLLHGVDGRFDVEIELDDSLGFSPIALSFDGESLYGTTDRDRGQRDLVEYDIASRQITRTLFSREGVDVVGTLRDAGGEVIGVSYYREGRRVSEYFGEQESREQTALQRAFPERSLITAARSVDGQQRLLWIDAADAPPQLFHFDAAQRTLSPVLHAQPWLEGLQFAKARVIHVDTHDGTRLEAFLTLPEGQGPHPLVLYPHGGPIGVADRLHFDHEVQFIASLGYAVLQVNFRGSEGYGRAFRDAGKRNFGRLIEDDIESALQNALASAPLDSRRMCVLGGSYGGFSALVATLRWPGRFRCAVSINGPTDLPLLFTASDASASDTLRTKLEEIVGSARTQLEELRASSPVYRAESLTTPLMLIQGERDVRVDPEHARRLLRMLELNNAEVSGLWFDEEGHAIATPANVHRMWRGIAGFLQQHLGGTSPPAS